VRTASRWRTAHGGDATPGENAERDRDGVRCSDPHLTTAQRDILTQLRVDASKKIIEPGPPPATS